MQTKRVPDRGMLDCVCGKILGPFLTCYLSYDQFFTLSYFFTVTEVCFTFLFFFKMLLTDISSNNTSAVHLDVSETKTETDNDHDNLMEDTLEAEISKLETTIHDLEATNDLPDIDSCAYDLEEGEILDSMIHEEADLGDSDIYERNEVIDNDGSYNGKFSDSDGGGILKSGKMSQIAECNKRDKLTVSSELYESDGTPNTVSHEKKSEPHFPKPSKTLQHNTLTYSPEPKTASYQECSVQHQKNDGKHTEVSILKPEPKIPNGSMFNPMKSVIISSNCKEVSLRSQDCEFSTNDVKVDLNSVNRTDVTSSHTPQSNRNAVRKEMCPVEADKDTTTFIRSSSLQDVDDVIQGSRQESYLQLNVSEFEDELLYPDDDDDDDNVMCTFSEVEDNEPLVSSTPFKIKAESLKRWKPTFLSFTESFLILDEFGESSDQEQSLHTYMNSSLQNSPIQKVSATHSIQPTSFTHNSFIFKVNEDSKITEIREEGSNDTEQLPVVFEEARDLKVVVKLSNEANDDSQSSSSCAQPSSVLTNTSPVQCHPVQDIFVPVMKAKDSETFSETEAVTRTVTVFGQVSTDNVPDGNTSDPNFRPESMGQNLLEQKPNIISKCDEDYVSNNPQENEDNNNPEWELLRKLETDEERYRAVRMRWRNLIIPDPNQDLTYRNWRIYQNANKPPASPSSTNKDAVSEQTRSSGSDAPSGMQDHRKRTMSNEQASSRCQPEMKRPRTQSCTAVFDVKLEQLRRNIEHEKQQICDQEQFALMQLSMEQSKMMNYLQNFGYTHGNSNEMQRQLYYRQLGVGNFWLIVHFSLQ
jgi:hypothetical protein